MGEQLALARTRNVVVIEDDFFTRDILLELLCDLPVELTCVSEASELALDVSPDLVISDLVGPFAHRAEGGGEYVRALRARFPSAKILILSAQSWIFRGLVGLPVDDVVAKPFDMEDLLLRVSALLDTAAAAPINETLGRAS